MRIGIKSGCFTIVHYGHIWCLQKCREKCDKLIILLNDDEYIKGKKGLVPITLAQRMEIMKECRSVDEVDWFSGLYETDKIAEIKSKNPNDQIIVFHSEETRGKNYIPGLAVVGEENIFYIPRIPNISTSKMIIEIQSMKITFKHFEDHDWEE